MREDSVEGLLVREGGALGALVFKSEQFMPGFPDRLILHPSAGFRLVETKAPGGRLEGSQVRCHRFLRRHQFEPHILWKPEEVRRFYREWLR